MKIYISMPTNDDNKLKRDEAIDVLKYHFCNEDVDFCYLEGEDLPFKTPLGSGHGLCRIAAEYDFHRTVAAALPYLYHIGEHCLLDSKRQSRAEFYLAGAQFELVVDIEQSRLRRVHIAGVEIVVGQAVM